MNKSLKTTSLRQESQRESEGDCSVMPKAYETPRLMCYGDVRDVTLGGTLGEGESGSGFEFTAPIMP